MKANRALALAILVGCGNGIGPDPTEHHVDAPTIEAPTIHCGMPPTEPPFAAINDGAGHIVIDEGRWIPMAQYIADSHDWADCIAEYKQM